MDPVTILNPKRVAPGSIPAERVKLGALDDQKPSLVRLPNGELLLVAFNIHPRTDKSRPFTVDTILFRSREGGQIWSSREVTGLWGVEPYLSCLKDGTIFITSHLHAADANNTWGYCVSYVHRSIDGGSTWQSMRIGAEDIAGARANAATLTSRNVLELADGTLVLGVSAGEKTHLWRSNDSGLTWNKTQACEFEDIDATKLLSPLMGEAILWEAASGDLLAICRVDPSEVPDTAPAKSLPGYDPRLHDQHDRLLVLRSRDGRTWFRDQPLGSDYGEMYPSILRLHDGRLLFTFTVRALHPPLGVHAVLGKETQSGLSIDFDTDRFVVDKKTPIDQISGGGFGPTVQLADGTLVTAYSYRGGDEMIKVDDFVVLKQQLEVARWRLPSCLHGENAVGAVS